jgi:hypothetical protein
MTHITPEPILEVESGFPAARHLFIAVGSAFSGPQT